MKKLCCKQCFCTHKALQAMSLFIQSGLVGKHPKPFDRAAPAGCSTSVARFCCPQQNRCMTKPPDRDSAYLRAFLVACGYFPCRGSTRALTAPAGCYAAQSGKFTTVTSATAFSTVCKMCSIFSTVSADRTTSPHCSHFRQGTFLMTTTQFFS